MKLNISQTPAPGEHLLRFRGDRITFVLRADPDAAAGRAFVRTNLGHARVTRLEIIRQVEFKEPRLGRDWFDIPMREAGPGRWETEIGLAEVGHFEAKCYFLPDGRREPLWPAGENTGVNVEPADTVCGNIIYNAFVRQFGPNKTRPRADYSAFQEQMKTLDRAGFAVIPPSGTFRGLIAELDFIMCRLGCRIIQLLPIHPTPTTYGRMGRFGSPYAALSFTAVDPALAVFDPKATPLDQFLELSDAVHARQGKLTIDIAINHTGWAASLHETHPEWLARTREGAIENPGAWGVIWADLTRLDYSHRDIWTYMAEVFLTWCRRGVDGFRCDAGYMIPLDAWQYIIAKVRGQFPDTIFFLEGLGGKISATRDLLNRANFNWAYSELFQNYDRGQIEWYLPGALEISASDGLNVHFAETHDNNRLAASGSTYARMRTALCALLSPCGAFAFANGVEWFATEKIYVHEAGGLNWGAEPNQVAEIARLSALLKTHPAFSQPVEMRPVSRGEGNFIAWLRRCNHGGRWLLVLANLDCRGTAAAGWDASQADPGDRPARDLLSGAMFAVHREGDRCRLDLAPGQVLCLAAADDPWPGSDDLEPGRTPAAITLQRLHAKVLEAAAAAGLADLPPEELAGRLQADPREFCRGLVPEGAAPPVIAWNHPRDLRRQVMVPPGHFVLLRAEHPFQARVSRGGRIAAIEESLPDRDGRPFVLLAPLSTPERHMAYRLRITLYDPAGARHDESDLLYLAPGGEARVRTSFSRRECLELPLLALGTDGRGAMMRAHAAWGRLASRYDSLLAANLDEHYPRDRQNLLARCRAWVVYQGFSQELTLDCLERFGFDPERGAWWFFRLPTGQGQHLCLHVTAGMPRGTADTVRLIFRRLKAAAEDELRDDREVTVIIRPDVEDRNFHECTKAYAGPEKIFPAAIRPIDKGFLFSPWGGHRLSVTVDRGRFVPEPEWYYMIHRPVEAERGLDPESDLFGPGWFRCSLRGGRSLTLTARASRTEDKTPAPPLAPESEWQPEEHGLPLEAAMEAALEQYVVRRGSFKTVIAGYPWFLDWGRDTLIVARGLAAAGRLDTVRDILVQFAGFEENGTIPNMIRGSDASDRHTSDAPLWLYTVCSDLAAAAGGIDFLKEDCGGRSLKQVLIDLAGALIDGAAPNGVVMDPDSGMIFSPAHFTWMDTNYPAATPRQGYPIEIQALWWAALDFLARIDGAGASRWSALAGRVRANILKLFWNPALGWLVDCRHALPGEGAARALPDDALRPNQLLALTLGAVDDPVVCRGVLAACQELLVPGAIRSLADRPVQIPIEVSGQGGALNDALNPYQGAYRGDEDTRRKPAYHNGTAWTWLFPSFCEAWASFFGPSGRGPALAWLSSSVELINAHCAGHVPEIVDGDAPHTQRGCDAQAWGVSELLRVWKRLS